MTRWKSQINIYLYLDHRAYLRDWHQEAKTSSKIFSYRLFSLKAGFKSPNFLKLVMEGKRNLSEEGIHKFATGLNLNKREKEYFYNLVLFNQAETHEQKNLHYQHLLKAQKVYNITPLEQDRYDYYSTWYHPVIRELMLSPGFDHTPEWIAKNIFPHITPQQAQKSMELLVKMGFVKMNRKGLWEQSNSLVSTGADVQSVILMNYHRSILDVTKEILNKVHYQQRDIHSLTLGIGKEQLPLLKKKVREFYQDILKVVCMEDKPEDIVLLNIQLLPVTKTLGEKRP